jgi:hypothetical protein
MGTDGRGTIPRDEPRQPGDWRSPRAWQILRGVGFPAHSLSPAEHSALLDAEREGAPFVAYRDENGDLRLYGLPAVGRVRIGRTVDNDIVLEGDAEVSRAHAHLDHAGGGWTLVDDGVSRNGSYVNGEKVLRHRRLEDQDMLRIGTTSILFRWPARLVVDSTVAAGAGPPVLVTDGERRVLVALCRPLFAHGVAAPATNAQIAAALHLSLPGVKSHVRSLFRKLGVEDGLAQNSKRAELARRALEAGLVTARDLET